MLDNRDQRSDHQEESPDILSEASEDEHDETPAINIKQKKAAKEKNWQMFPKEAFKDFELEVLEGKTRRS